MPYSVSPRRNDHSRGPKPRKYSVTFMPAPLGGEEVAELVEHDHDDDGHDDDRGTESVSMEMATMAAITDTSWTTDPSAHGRPLPLGGTRLAADAAAVGACHRVAGAVSGRHAGGGVGRLGDVAHAASPRRRTAVSARSRARRSASIDVTRRRRRGSGRRRSSVSATTSAMAPHPMRPAEEGGHGHLVAGVQPGRGQPAGPARLLGQVEAGEDLAVGLLEVEAAQRWPSRWRRRACGADRG